MKNSKCCRYSCKPSPKNHVSESFNTVIQLRVLGRWMRMLTTPNQFSVPKAFFEFDESGRRTPSAYYDRVIDVMEELVKFTLLLTLLNLTIVPK
jgi:NAD(P)H-dependent FMN reductase